MEVGGRERETRAVDEGGWREEKGEGKEGTEIKGIEGRGHGRLLLLVEKWFCFSCCLVFACSYEVLQVTLCRSQ